MIALFVRGCRLFVFVVRVMESKTKMRVGSSNAIVAVFMCDVVRVLVCSLRAK